MLFSMPFLDDCFRSQQLQNSGHSSIISYSYKTASISFYYLTNAIINDK